MSVNKTKDQKQKIQSPKKENEYDILDSQKLFRNENYSSLYEEFFSINKDEKNQEIIKQFENSKKVQI